MSIDDINLFVLHYVIDAVLFAKSPHTLQHILDKLYKYSCIWDLKVNTEKQTKKIMILKG